jgi:hypothetical protein
LETKQPVPVRNSSQTSRTNTTIQPPNKHHLDNHFDVDVDINLFVPRDFPRTFFPEHFLFQERAVFASNVEMCLEKKRARAVKSVKFKGYVRDFE